MLSIYIYLYIIYMLSRLYCENGNNKILAKPKKQDIKLAMSTNTKKIRTDT